jgi:cellulose biosynthesis protein BcsQ
VSIAGGVGKTTISANVGRILSERGEHVLLVDATGSGLLPFYFGAEDMRSGMRTFLAPEPELPPIRILGAERVTHEWLAEEVKPAMQTAQRTIFDLGPASYSLLPEILPLCAMILIPLVVDLNSIMSIPRAEAHNKAMRTEHGLAELPKPFYLVNKLDATSERERHGRELIEREVGERLLPFSIRRSTSVADAISGRMTVSDYVPESDIAQDFIQLALWIKNAVPVTQPATHTGRWSEA